MDLNKNARITIRFTDRQRSLIDRAVEHESQRRGERVDAAAFLREMVLRLISQQEAA